MGYRSKSDLVMSLLDLVVKLAKALGLLSGLSCKL
jgi:hypothetical protein